MKQRVGIDNDDRVKRFEFIAMNAEQPVQRLALAPIFRVGSFKHTRADGFGQAGCVIIAVISDYKRGDKFRRMLAVLHAANSCRDSQRFVMSRHHHSHFDR